MMDRRRFLRTATAASLAGTALHGVPGTLTAHAAQTGGYRALVCVFLFGGLDGHDVLLPHDQPSYDGFARIRQSLLAEQGESRSRDALLPITPTNQSAFGSRRFALPPEMPRLHALFGDGEASIVANVGPLLEPVTARGFADGSARVPPRLFSHNDQQATWQASRPEGAQLGWGGLFADAALAAGANGAPEFTTLAAAEVGPFLTGRDASPYQVSVSGSAGLAALGAFEDDPSRAAFAPFLTSARDRFRAAGFAGDNVLARDIARLHRDGIDANTAFDAARGQAAPLLTAFPETPLGAQLRAVAETLSVRDRLGASRQVFFVGTGGFDTHSNQADDLPGLLTQIDGALGAFRDALVELGLYESVTTFTASDFGRTLAVNGDGTDHGWGGHHVVMGGDVRGGAILGDVPPPEFGHEWDGGGGRLVPSLAVEQLAAPLGRWWGLNDAEVATALPNLGNFPAASLPLFG